MKVKLLALFVALLMVGCGEEDESALDTREAGELLEGKVFISTLDGQVIKRGDVTVRAFPASFQPRLKQLFAEVEANTMKEMNPEKNDLESFQKEFLDNFFSQLEQIDTPFKAPTGPDGNFLLKRPKGDKFAIAARDYRVGTVFGVENYYWFLTVEVENLPPSGLFLSGSNMLYNDGSVPVLSPVDWNGLQNRFKQWRSSTLDKLAAEREAARKRREKELARLAALKAEEERKRLEEERRLAAIKAEELRKRVEEERRLAAIKAEELRKRVEEERRLAMIEEEKKRQQLEEKRLKAEDSLRWGGVAVLTDLDYSLVLNAVDLDNRPNEYSGWAKTLHANGQIWFLAQFKDGKRNGMTFVFHESGRKKAKGIFKDGNLLQDTWVRW